MLVVALAASWPAFASAGCNAFYGQTTDTTEGPGGSRGGWGFDKGDVLVVTLYNDAAMMKVSAHLLQYSSPDGPSQALTPWMSDSFTYTVPADTGDYIGLSFSMNKGAVVTWSCKSARTD